MTALAAAARAAAQLGEPHALVGVLYGSELETERPEIDSTLGDRNTALLPTIATNLLAATGAAGLALAVAYGP